MNTIRQLIDKRLRPLHVCLAVILALSFPSILGMFEPTLAEVEAELRETKRRVAAGDVEFIMDYEPSFKRDIFVP